MSRTLVRLGVVLTAAVGLLVGGGSFAAAHVSVHADEAVQGGSSEIAFRVPTESDTASTVSVLVAFPTDTPIAKVTVLPQAGWTYQVTTAKTPDPVPAGHGTTVSEVVSQIEWRATGPDAAVKPGEYQVFRISAGPLPEVDQLVFKVVQTYGDGQTQRWIDEPVGDGAEPEHPAPVLAVGAAGPASHGHDEVAVVPAASSTSTTQGSSWWAAMTVAVAALVAALTSLVVSIRTGRRRGGGESAA